MADDKKHRGPKPRIPTEIAFDTLDKEIRAAGGRKAEAAHVG